MGYLFLFTSIISGGIKGYFAKKVSDNTSGLKGAVFANFIRMLFCIPLGLLFVFFDGNLSDFKISGQVLLISIFAGLTTSILIVSWLFAAQQSAFTALDTFIALGILVPIVLSSIFYQETVSISQIIGLILLFAAVILMSLYSNQIKQKLSVVSLLLLMTVGVSNGLTDFSYKIFQYTNSGTPASVFNFYIYSFSALTLFLLFLFLHFKSRKVNKPAPVENKTAENCYTANCEATGTCGGEKSNIEVKDDVLQNEAAAKVPLLTKKKTVYIAIMATCLFCNSYFKTLATNYLSAVLIYPLVQGASIIISLLMSAIFFKEKIKPLCIVGLAILFMALLFINVFVF